MARTVRSVQKSGIRTKAGRVGKSAQYWTRARALRKLQVSLKDFRRLCILKGVYPREAPKGKDKSKVYYHAKDIKYLSHERLIQNLRDIKVWMKRRQRLIGRYEQCDIEKLKMPIMKLDHLVRERYPNITDALRDLDDPLTLLHLFHTLRVRVHKSFTEKNAEMVARLISEWKNYVISQKSLRKVFVSIKGYYFQANIKGQLITWLVPHQAMQKTPGNVDYEVMTTFLRFYETMLRCVNLKLYKEQSFDYPPTLPTEEEVAKTALSAGEITSSNSSTNKKKDTTKVSANVLKSVMNKQKQTKEDDDDDNDGGDDKEENDQDKFQQLDETLQLGDADAEASSKTFAGCVILVGRETAFEQISLVIRCGGGIALHETSMPADQISSKKITHQVVDRPKMSGQKLMGRQYIQPQWVFDSFNMRSVLPIAPYAPGTQLPPHLSPFVDDQKENYIPEQRNQLRAWVGLPPLKSSVLNKIISEEALKKREEDGDEAEYQRQLREAQKNIAQADKKKLQDAKKKQQEEKKAVADAKKKPVAKVAAKQVVEDDDDDGSDIELDMDMGSDDDDDDDEDAEVEDVSDDDFDEETFMNDSDEDDDDDEMVDDEEKKIAAKPKPVARPRPINTNERDLSRIMMNKKDKRLHSRMIYGKGRQTEQAKILTTKRKAAAAGVENPSLPRRNYRPTRQR
jgi:pescadillo protein